MSRLADLSDLVSHLLRTHQDAPEVCTIRVSQHVSGPDVEMQVAYQRQSDELLVLAGWATALGTGLRLIPSPGQVKAAVDAEVTTPAGVSGVVQIWTSLTWPAALQVANRLGIELRPDTGPVFLAAGHVLRALKAGA